VAPPDYHLTVAKGKVALWHGPKENGHRPAVDPLFRTAARNYGARVVGVVLTGTFDCGTAGLLAIKVRNGLAVVQDPRDCVMPDMPRHAIEHVKVDDIVPIAGMAERLVERLQEPVKGAFVMSRASKSSEVISNVVCPACQGSLTETEIQGLLQFRCHVGHAFSLQNLAAQQANALESALWAGVRALEESAALAERMAGRSLPPLRSRYEDKGRAMRRQADVIRHMLLHEELLAEPDASLPRSSGSGGRPLRTA
jgi:two-component system chemotaxis response regulator CheB